MPVNSDIRSSEFVANPRIRFVWYGVVALLLSVIHVVFLRFLEVSSVTPDLLLIFTVWVALVEGQFTGMIAGFLCGLLFDAVSTDVIGTNALAKTVAGFIAGFFYREGFVSEIIGSARFLFIVASTSSTIFSSCARCRRHFSCSFYNTAWLRLSTPPWQRVSQCCMRIGRRTENGFRVCCAMAFCG